MRNETQYVYSIYCSEFEQNIEDVRRSLVESNRKMRMSDVEALTNALTGLGRTAAKLKSRSFYL